MLKFLKQFFSQSFLASSTNNDPVLSTLNKIEDYDRKSWEEIIENLNKPMKKSDFVIQAERSLGLNLPEYY